MPFPATGLTPITVVTALQLVKLDLNYVVEMSSLHTSKVQVETTNEHQ